MSQTARIKITRGKKDFHLTLNGVLMDFGILAYIEPLFTGQIKGTEMYGKDLGILCSYFDADFFPLQSGDFVHITDDKGTREYEFIDSSKWKLKQTFNADFDTSDFAEEKQPSLIDFMEKQGLSFGNSNIQFGNYTYTTLDWKDTNEDL